MSPKIDYTTFYCEFEDYYKQHKEYLRYGQALMNYLYTVSENAYNSLVISGRDCFHQDVYVPECLQLLEENWNTFN